MTAAVAGFPVEEFLEAITAQLDRTQDALRLKAVNRPLTYAIRDFSMELKVFVELAQDGRVMLRPSASNDTGASVVNIAFTTVNRTMIDENTVSLSSVRSPSLDELGLDEQERRQLEKLGVRNAAQLDELGRQTGTSAVSRFSGLPVNRLRQAMAQGQPRVHSVEPAPRVGAHPPVAARGPVDQPPPPPTPPVDPSPAEHPAPGPRLPVATPPSHAVRLPKATRTVRIGGHRLDEVARTARLNNKPLSVRPVDGGLDVDLGHEPSDGLLELDLGDDGIVAMPLEFEPHDENDTDPWRPR